MVTRKKLLLLITLLFSFNILVLAQNKSNKGKEFWLGYGHNILFTYSDGNGVNSQVLVLYLCTEQAAVVTVSVNSTGFSQTVNIPANTVDYSITIPKTGTDDARLRTEGLSTKGIHVVSDVPIVAYAHQYGILSSAATMLMPVETFGYTYYSLNYSQTTNYGDSYSWFFVVASENNTRLEITPSDTTEGGWLPNHTYTVNLQKGEIYNVFGKATGSLTGKDMTGSKIVSVAGADGSCHPVGLFSGSSRNIILSSICNGSGQYLGISNGNGGELLMQQIFPANAWGTKYITYHTVNNIGGNISTPFLNVYRVAVRNPATIVKRNGVVLTGLTNNFYYEFSSNTGDIIESDQPILVAQYTVSANECVSYNNNPLGDPEMIYLSPIEQGVKKAIFYNTRKEAISLSFVNIIVPANAISSLLIDGQPFSTAEYITHPANTNYVVAVKKLTGSGAQHILSCDSTFIATVYGVGTTESYGYNVGTLVNNLNSYSSIKNTFNLTSNADTFTCAKTPFKLFIKLSYKATKIQWKFSQLGSAITPNIDSVITNPMPLDSASINGRKYYTYSLQQDFILNTVGSFQIPVLYTAPDIDACNQTEQISINIEVKNGPKADFTYTGGSCIKDTVNFTGSFNSAGYNITKYLWNFDDNTTANTTNTTKLFTTSGNQNIRFRIFADNGCSGDTIKNLTIKPSPIAKLGVALNSCAKDSVYISDTSFVATGSITNWYYNFGDGNTQNNNSSTGFYHPYNLAGNYTIKLVTTSNNNCISDTAYKIITVNPKPIAKFGYNKNICVGDSIKFSDSSTVVTGFVTTWKWIFGDGNNQTNTTNSPFYHTYSSVGNYEVKLVALSDNGCVSDTFKLTVTVVNKPTSTFTIAGKPCVDSLYTFTSSSTLGTGNPPVWYWSFADGQTISTSTTHIATHAYSNTATNLQVKHVVSYGAGCISDTSSNTIAIINNNPIASFTYVGDTLCEKKPIVFNATTNSNITNWNWLFDTVIKTDAPPITYHFNTANTYNVSLTVKENSGCTSAPFTKAITINPTPNIDAGLSKVILKGASTTLDATISNASNYNFLWTPSLGLSAHNILNPIATPLVTTLYTVTAIDKLNYCYNSDSTKITVVNKLNIPNVFSPNGDGVNDKWIIEGIEFYPAAVVSIFDRNGQVVYERKNYKVNPWDGAINGKTVPIGVYPYIIQLSKEKGDYIAGILTILK